MTTKELALGRLFDISIGQMTIDAVANTITGKRVHMKHGGVLTILVLKATDAGTADDLAVDLQEHSAASGGTSQDLDIITDFFKKTETALDGDETWVRTTQTAASEIAAIAGTAELEAMLVIEVQESQLSDGFGWLSLNLPDLGSTDVQNVTVVYILSSLAAERKPENLPDWLT